MNSKKYIWIAVIVIFFLLSIAAFMVWLKMSGRSISIQGHGHGSYAMSGFSAFLGSLGIPRDYDTIIDDEEICLNYDCWDEADDAWDRCISLLGEGELSGLKDYSIPFEIVPAVSAVGIAFPDYDFPECDAEYERTLLEECRIPCPEEVYVWDGTPITDLNGFYEANYPLFYESSTEKCYYFDGMWISEPDKVGCVDFWGFHDDLCTEGSIGSAGTVCTTIGKIFTCNSDEISCST